MTSQNLLRLMNRRKGFKSTSDLTSYKISTVDFIAPNRGAAFTGIGLGERERYLNTSLWRQKLILTLTKRVFGIKSEIPITLMAASSTDDLPAVKDHVGELLKAHFDRSHSRWVWIMYNVTFFFQGSSLATSNFDRSNAKALTSHFTLSRNPPKKTHTHTQSITDKTPRRIPLHRLHNLGKANPRLSRQTEALRQTGSIASPVKRLDELHY